MQIISASVEVRMFVLKLLLKSVQPQTFRWQSLIQSVNCCLSYTVLPKISGVCWRKLGNSL